MTSTPHSETRSIFFEARIRAEREWSSQQRRAVRMVAGQAHDVTDLTALLTMLDLDDPALRPEMLHRRLATYIRQVAVAIDVLAEATGYEVNDTATAYLSLDQRCATQPDHDLILVWDERLGWYITVNNPITKAPAVIAYLDGDIVPPPAAVAQFVAEATAGRARTQIRPVQPPTEHAVLAAKMAAACPGAR